MTDGEPRARVGIRELRQNLSIYVDRVKDGETLEVTEHGHPVAELGPLRRPSKSLYQDMLADGRIRPARGAMVFPQLLELPEGSEPISETLRKMREEEHY
jgi:prevent-host-death family protein